MKGKSPGGDCGRRDITKRRHFEKGKWMLTMSLITAENNNTEGANDVKADSLC